jgi:hypothetical protein
VCWLCGALHAQPVVIEVRQVSPAPGPNPESNLEPAIVASTVDPNQVLVAWQHIASGVQTVQYATSNNGLATLAFGPAAFPTPVAPCPPLAHQFDVGVARSAATGDLYLSMGWTADEDTVGTFVIARKPLGSATALVNSVQMVPCAFLDKDFIAIGPLPGPGGNAPASSERAFVGYTDRDN